MITLSITYPNSETATFDLDYYTRTHLPMIGPRFAPFGLVMASVLRGVEQPDGSAAAYVAQCLLTFSDDQAAKNALGSEGGKDLRNDMLNYTNIQPVVQFNAPID